MKAIKLSIMALAISVTAVTAYAQTADEVIQKHIAAIGGTKNWDKVKSIKLTGTLNVQGNDVAISQTIVNDKAMRMDVSAMGMNGYIIVTPTKGWQYMPFAGQTEIQEIPAEQLKDAVGQLNYRTSQLVDKANVTKAKMEGKDTINSVACYKVNVTNKEGKESMCYFDAATYYMVKQEMKIKAQDEEQEVAVNYSNFKKLPEGIVIPMSVTSPQGDIVFKSVEINKPINDKIFTPDVVIKK